jgi:phosphoglycerol transferase MdoB-like AlkP superfamily enzyme
MTTAPHGGPLASEAGYVAEFKQYDAAFCKFFARLVKDGITKDNTLFLVVLDENDHFVGSTPRIATLPSGMHLGAEGHTQGGGGQA